MCHERHRRQRENENVIYIYNSNGFIYGACGLVHRPLSSRSGVRFPLLVMKCWANFSSHTASAYLYGVLDTWWNKKS